MTLGTSVFISAIIISFVALFIATKDKWNWGKGIKRLLLWSLILIVGLSVIGGVVYWYSELPKKQTEFLGIKLGATKSDVKFLKGTKGEYSSEDDWQYKEEETDYSDKKTLYYGVGFRDEKVRFVMLRSYNGYSWKYDIEGISDKSSIADIERKFGKKYEMVESEEGLTRLYMYPKYNTFFILDSGTVYYYGIYDPSKGPLKLVKEEDKNLKFRMLPDLQQFPRKKK